MKTTDVTATADLRSAPYDSLGFCAHLAWSSAASQGRPLIDAERLAYSPDPERLSYSEEMGL